MSSSIWNPLTLTTSKNYGIILLNQPIKINAQSFLKLWNQAKFRIAVDGGTNHLYNMEKNGIPIGIKPPDLITGDFDSIRQNVKDYYEAIGSKIVATPDQNYTDFTKSILELKRGIGSGEYPKITTILAIAESSGRYDQYFANINTLCKTLEMKLDFEVYLLSNESLAWILSRGTHQIHITKEYLASEGTSCGLIPLNGKTLIKTTGLKWNLDHATECYFGGMVSTSNQINQEMVNVDTNDVILWTMTPKW